MTFPHTATIKRSTKANGKYTFLVVGTTICFLQPLDVEKAQLYGVTFGKSARIFLPYGADVQESDRIVANGVTYGVRGVVARDYGRLQHAYAILGQL